MREIEEEGESKSGQNETEVVIAIYSNSGKLSVVGFRWKVCSMYSVWRNKGLKMRSVHLSLDGQTTLFLSPVHRLSSSRKNPKISLQFLVLFRHSPHFETRRLFLSRVFRIVHYNLFHFYGWENCNTHIDLFYLNWMRQKCTNILYSFWHWHRRQEIKKEREKERNWCLTGTKLLSAQTFYRTFSPLPKIRFSLSLSISFNKKQNSTSLSSEREHLTVKH